MTLDTATASPAAQPAPGELARRRRRRWGLAAMTALLAVLLVLGLLVGSRMFGLVETVQAVFTDNGDAHVIVTGQRLPRTVLAVLVGAALAVAGALMQAQTRNPLADPGLFGVSSGAAFAIVVAALVLPGAGPWVLIWVAFAGAVLATVAVYLIGTAGGRGSSPLTLILAGVAIGAFLSGVGTTLEILFSGALRAGRLWAAGNLDGHGWSGVLLVLPFLLVGVLLAALASHGLNAEGLGSDLATALGSDRRRTRDLVVVSVTLLAGSATAVVGVIFFVGMMVPHAARWITGPDQRWILAYCLLMGPILMLAADIVGRVIVSPDEVPAGLVTAFLGAPVLIAMARRTRISGL